MWPMLAMFSICGSVLLLPFAILDIVHGALPTANINDWANIGGIILFSSLLAYSTYQFGVRNLGAPIASIFMYLTTPFGLGLAWLFLNEPLQGFHIIAMFIILSGVMCATFTSEILNR